MRERVLITGASGFVGYHLIEEALKNNLEVYAAIRKSSRIEQLKNFDIQYTYPAFNDVASLTKDIHFNQYDYIIHAAGITSAVSRKQYDKVNALYAYNLAKAAEACGIKKFVFISSLAAVGPLKTLNGIITDHTKPAPVSSYGKSKLLAEDKISSLQALNYTILRPAAVYGPGEKKIFFFIRQIVKKAMELYIGNAGQKLSFVHVTDLAAATVKALYATGNNTYNISDGNFYSRYELGDIVKSTLKLRAAKFHSPVNFAKLVAAVNGKISYLRGKVPAISVDKVNELIALNWHCDIENAKAALGYYPRYNLHTGMAQTLEWYKINKWL